MDASASRNLGTDCGLHESAVPSIEEVVVGGEDCVGGQTSDR